MADIIPFDLAGSLQAHNAIVQQRQQLQAQNALTQAVPMLQSDPQNAFATAARTSPQAALQLIPYIKQMADEKKAALADRADALGKLAYTLKSQYPDPVIRKAVAMSQASQLAAHGITPDQIQNYDYSDQNLQSTINQSQSVQGLIAEADKQRTFGLDQSKQAETERHNKVDEANSSMTARAAMVNATSGNKQWQVLTDPKTNTQYRYNPVTGKATTLDGATPYEPSGAAKISSGQPRSAASLAATRYIQEHPDATAEDVTQFAANYARINKSVSGFGSGKQGDQVRCLGVAVSHLNTLSTLADALNNGDVQAFNKIGQYVAQQTGSAAPTNFDTAKQLVGDEITKAIIGAGGTGGDRAQAQAVIARANSPQQLKGAIHTYQQLLGGQLQGLKHQYEISTGRTDFENMLTPETRSALEPPPAAAATPTSGWSNFKVHN